MDDNVDYVSFYVSVAYIGTISVLLFGFSFIFIREIYHHAFGPFTRHDHDNNKSIESKEVVMVVLDEHKLKEVSKNCTECAICLEKLDHQIKDDDEKREVKWILKQCGHKFHEACVIPWLYSNYSCPTCRRVLPSVTLEGINIES